MLKGKELNYHGDGRGGVQHNHEGGAADSKTWQM